MRAVRFSSMLCAALVLASCSDPVAESAAIEIPVLFNQSAHASPQSQAAHNFGAHATGGEEVPPNPSKAQGNAVFKLSADGASLEYKLIVANIQNVTQAHIHCAPAGLNGQIVLWLYPSAPPATEIPGRSSGILNQDVATDADIIPRGDSAVCPGGVANLAELVEKMRTGGAYVNVHTRAFPPGEIRGQIKANGPSN